MGEDRTTAEAIAAEVDDPIWVIWAEQMGQQEVQALAELDAELAQYEDKLVDLGRRIYEALEPYRRVTLPYSHSQGDGMSDEEHEVISVGSNHHSIFCRASNIMDSLGAATDETRKGGSAPSWWGEVTHWPPKISREQMAESFRSIPEAMAGEAVEYQKVAIAAVDVGAGGTFSDFNEALEELIALGYVDTDRNALGVKMTFTLTDKALAAWAEEPSAG